MKIDEKTKKENKTEENYYKLNKDAVEKLAKANEGVVDKMDKEEYEKYNKKTLLSKIPYYVKALFIKYWFYGSLCFFFYMGLGNVISSTDDLMLVLGFAIGIFDDIIINNIFRFIETSDKEYDKFMLLPMKKFYTIFINVAYGFVRLIIVMNIYNIINEFFIIHKNLEETTITLGVEPLFFGLFYLIVDMAFVWLKNLIVYIIKIIKTKQKDNI